MFDQSFLDYLEKYKDMTEEEFNALQKMQPMLPPGKSIIPNPPPLQEMTPEERQRYRDMPLPPPPPPPPPPGYDPNLPEIEANANPGLLEMNRLAMSLGGSGGSDTMAGGGGDDSLLGQLDNRPWGPMLMALGGGIASGADRGWGAGLGAGFQGAAAARMRSEENAQQERLARDKMAQAAKEAAQGSTGQYGTPLFGKDAEGNNYVGALSKSANGGVVWYGRDGKPAAGKDITYEPGVTWQNFDTHRQAFDKGGAAVGDPIQRELAKAEEEKVAGKGAGEARELYASMNSKLPGLRDTVEKLDVLAGTATYTKAGQGVDVLRKELQLPPRKGAVDRTEYMAIVDNQILPLLRDTFGAQFTASEGEALRATLGDPNKQPLEKRRVLNAFIDQKIKTIDALARRGGAGGGAGGGDPLGIR